VAGVEGIAKSVPDKVNGEDGEDFPEMAVVEKVLRLAADGLGQCAIQTRLFREGGPRPQVSRTGTGA
jgi:hypothetical protein